MDKTKREKLEANGWSVGTVADFLELTPEEATLIEIKVCAQSSATAKAAGENDAGGAC